MLTLTPLQLFILALFIFATAILAFCLGLIEGRAREACEPTQEIADDDGESFRGRHV